MTFKRLDLIILNTARLMFTIFCDETGNSGSRFFTPEQPVYAQGGWYVQKDHRLELEQAVLELEKQYGYLNGQWKKAVDVHQAQAPPIP